MAGTIVAKTRFALYPARTVLINQFLMVMQEMSERFRVRHTASA